MTSSLCANVRLLNQGGVKLYNVLIDIVVDTSKDSPYLKRGSSGVRVGDIYLYGDRHATSKETYNISIKNVVSRAVKPINLAGEIGNITIENIMTFDEISE